MDRKENLYRIFAERKWTLEGNGIIPGARKVKRKGEEWKVGSNKAESNYCFELIERGVKTATSYLYDEKTFIPPTKYSILKNWDGTKELEIITQRYYITAFKDVTERQADREGEGRYTLEEWRTTRKKFFSEELAKQGKEFDDNTLIVCEEFYQEKWIKKE